MSNRTGPFSQLQHQVMLERLNRVVSRDIENDARYFERHPDRSTYLRLAYKSERQVQAIIGGPPAPGTRSYAIVHKINDDTRVRSFFDSVTVRETDLTEAEARTLMPELEIVIADMRATYKAAGK